MVKDGLATTNADLGTGSFDNLLGIQSGSHAMAFDTSARARHHHLGAVGRRTTPTSRSVSHRCRAPSHKGGVLVSGGSLYMVNKSAPAKQAAAWKFLKFLDEPENMTTWAIGTGYIPIRKSSAEQRRDAAVLGAEPHLQGRLRPAPRPGRPTPATSGSVIGQLHRRARRGARRGEQHVPQRHRPEDRAEGRGEERHRRDRGLQLQARAS